MPPTGGIRSFSVSNYDFEPLLRCVAVCDEYPGSVAQTVVG
jgi:hypothetical protein